MITMVVHALDTAVRVMVQTRMHMGNPMLGTQADRHIISALLKRETILAIADPLQSPNNMSEFEDRNFKPMILSDVYEENNDEYRGQFPIAHIQRMKVAFAMVTRLRCDLIKNIFLYVWNS
jgi:hypothetical protein